MKNILKITINADGQNISLIKFGSSQEEFDKLYTELGQTVINVIGHFQKNIWNGNISPQISIEDYELTKKQNYYF